MPRRKLGTFAIPPAAWWDQSERVVIRDLNTADEEWIQDQMATMSAERSQQSQAEMQMHLGTVRRLTLMRAIEDWTLVDPETHQPIPMPRYAEDPRTIAIRNQSLSSLPPEDTAYIYEQINKRNQPMTEAEQSAFLTPATSGTAEPHTPHHLTVLSHER